MDSLAEVVLLGLVCYRVARMLAREEGPWEVFKRVRIRLGAYDYGPDGEAKTLLGRGASCPYCIGFWIALPLALLATMPSVATLLYWFGIAGMQTALQAREA